MIPTNKYEGLVYQIESTVFGHRNTKSKCERPWISGYLISLSTKPLSELSVLTNGGKYIRVKVITSSLRPILPSTINEINTGQQVEAIWKFILKSGTSIQSEGDSVNTWWGAEIMEITPCGNKDVLVRYLDNSSVELYLNEIK